MVGPKMDMVLRAFKLRGRQFYAVQWKNVMNFRRDTFKYVAGAILVPLLSLGALIAFRDVMYNVAATLAADPETHTVPQDLPKCHPGPGDFCHSVVMFPHNSVEIEEIGRHIAERNNPPLTFSTEANATTEIVLTANLYTFLDYVNKNPNRTLLGLHFENAYSGDGTVGGVVQMGIFFNDTEHQGDYVHDHRHAVLMAAQRAVIEVRNDSRIDLVFKHRLIPTTLARGDWNDVVSAFFAPLFLFVGLGYVQLSIITSLVSQRKNKQKQQLFLYGLKDSIYWYDFGSSALVRSILVALIIAAVGRYYDLWIFEHKRSDYIVGVLPLLALSYVWAAVGSFVSTYIDQPRSASVFWLLLMILSSLGVLVIGPVFSYILGIFPGTVGKAVVQFLLPNLTFATTVNEIFFMSMGDEGAVHRVTFDDLKLGRLMPGDESGTRFEPPWNSIKQQMITGTLLIALAWYRSSTKPIEGRTPRPWYFLFTPSYWGFGEPAEPAVVTETSRLVTASNDVDISREFQESMHGSADLRLLKLSKTYGARKRFGRPTVQQTRAVDEVNLTAGKGTLLAILGHNGAGKTTAVNMLNGLETPTSGDALIYGRSMAKEPMVVQNMMGVCTQHDVIWGELSALETVQYVCRIRGVSHPRATSLRILKLVGLTRDQNRSAAQYSGGMKRKLTLALSLVGNPKVLFLDEPTSGMDPLHRRKVWELIRELKKDRICVLTTHSMEEADILADKLAILADGRLRAVGTPVHLKRRFGSGYKLHLTLKSPTHADAVKRSIERTLPARLETEREGSVVYALPFASSVEISACLKSLETGELDIASLLQSWGIQHSSLSEVFVQVTCGEGGVNREGAAGGQAAPAGQAGAAVLPDGRYQLNVCVRDGPPHPVGFVLIDPLTTLAQVRDRIIDQLAPSVLPADHFVMLMSGVGVTPAQESSLRALFCLPVLTLAPRPPPPRLDAATQTG